MASDDDDPRAPYKVYEGDERRALPLRALRHGERNNGWPRPSRSATSLSWIFLATFFHDWHHPDGGVTPQIRRGRLSNLLCTTHTSAPP